MNGASEISPSPVAHPATALRAGFRNRLIGSFVLTAAILCVIGITIYRSVQGFIHDNTVVAQTHEVLETLSRTIAGLDNVETGQRGYVITGQENYLDVYHLALTQIDDNIRQLFDLTRDNPEQQKRIPLLKIKVQNRLRISAEIVALRRHEGFEAARQAVLTGRGKREMDSIRTLIADMQQTERRLLSERSERAHAAARSTLLASTLGIGSSFVILLFVFSLIQREGERRLHLESSLESSNDRLQTWVQELERLTREMELTGTLGELLQSCRSAQEAHTVIGRMLPQLLPNVSGAVCIINASQNLVEVVGSWGGETSFTQSLFAPDQCWCLRRGRMHLVQDVHAELPCQHLANVPPAAYLCMPMMAHGEAMGVLFLAHQSPGGFPEAKQQVARTVAEQVSLALANLQLQETLRTQSIRDPLTGLFNRRYLEASLEREIQRAGRRSQPLSVIMLDIDHFKRFNDTFGHDAGDALLSEFGQFLGSQVRGEDIACRYGGEEFTLILPDAALEVAAQRAEQLRELAQQISVRHRRQNLEAITISIGVAAFPSHAATGEELMRAADAALYAAKRQGRNRVVVAGAAPVDPAAAA